MPGTGPHDLPVDRCLMQPLISAAEMAAVDAAAPDLGALIERAGAAVARAAIAMLGGTYGRRVAIVAGPGNNGADGIAAGRMLERRGVRVMVVSPTASKVPPADLVIDAAFGMGLNRPYTPPALRPESRVLAVDVPSGLDADVGRDLGGWNAERTITFGAMCPGHVLGSGPRRCGVVEVADIGLDLSAITPNCFHLTPVDAARYLRRSRADDHKWNNAVRVVAGGPGMSGAAILASSAALRSGSGMVVVGRPDGEPIAGLWPEVVERPGLGDAGDHRFASWIIGPGIARSIDQHALVALVGSRTCPVVFDADALNTLAADVSQLATNPGGAPNSGGGLVLTPHDGEFARLMGRAPDGDRVGSAVELAQLANAVVLLKGPTTVVAGPDGSSILVNAGDERLATAGSGDVLAGIIGANIGWCRTQRELMAAVAASAVLHGEAARLAGRYGLVASDLVAQLGAARGVLERGRS